MSKHDGWFDDYMMMQMMEEDNHRESGSSSANGTDGGCFSIILGLLVILVFLSMVVG